MQVRPSLAGRIAQATRDQFWPESLLLEICAFDAATANSTDSQAISAAKTHLSTLSSESYAYCTHYESRVPLWFLALFMPYIATDNIRLLSLFQKLGIDLSQLDSRGNNALHVLITIMSTNAMPVNMLDFFIKQGLSIHDKNQDKGKIYRVLGFAYDPGYLPLLSQGLNYLGLVTSTTDGNSVLDLASKRHSPETCQYLRFLEQKYHGLTAEQLAAESSTALLRRQAYIAARHGANFKRSKAEHHALLKMHPFLFDPIPKPTVDASFQAEKWVSLHAPEDQAAAKKVADSVRYISFQEFRRGLKQAVEKFNEHLQGFAADQRGYVLIIDYKYKSGSWASSLALKYLAVPPVAVIEIPEISKLPSDIHFSHVCYINDGSYTGQEAFRSIEKMYRDQVVRAPVGDFPTAGVNVIIPYLSEQAHNTLKELNIQLFYSEVIPNFNFNSALVEPAAFYFQHKIGISTIAKHLNNTLLAGNGTKASTEEVIAKVVPPYKPK